MGYTPIEKAHCITFLFLPYMAVLRAIRFNYLLIWKHFFHFHIHVEVPFTKPCVIGNR